MNDIAVHVAGCCALTALGDLKTTWEGLNAGRSALCLPGAGGDGGFRCKGPIGAVPELEEFRGEKRLKQLLRLLHDQISHALPLEPGTGLVLATTKGAVDELLMSGQGSLPIPGDLKMQPWNLAQYLAELEGITGPVSTVSAACASGTVALVQAALRIMSGEVPAMLVVGIDILSEFVLAGFGSLQALSGSVCRPFDRRRDGLALGEGAAAMLLAGGGSPDRNGTEGKILVQGWGIACDAVHITAPARDARGLVAAIKMATSGGTVPVGAINAHGTGTVFNDAMEICAFETLWPDDDRRPPFHSIKGATGHCLGAAGIIEACMAAMSLEKGEIPPTVGLEAPEPGAVPVSGDGPLALEYPSVLTCNSGFGGINAALLFQGHSGMDQ